MFGPAAAVVDQIAVYADTTGKLIAASTVSVNDIATITYVDDANDAQDAAQLLIDAAQDAAIALNTAFVAAQPGVDGAQDTAINNKITKPAAVAVIGNIATFADVAGLAALDGGRTIAQLDAAIAARGDVTGPGVTVAANLAVFSGTTGKIIADGGQSIASIQTYVDDAIAAIPGATPPLVTAPELTGNGVAGTPITFTGITTDPTIGAGAAGATFSGLGLSTDPLVLEVVDGGEYV